MTPKPPQVILSFKCTYCSYTSYWKSNADRHERTCKNRTSKLEHEVVEKLHIALDKRVAQCHRYKGKIAEQEQQLLNLKEDNAVLRGKARSKAPLSTQPEST
jgi:hypothetical protein